MARIESFLSTRLFLYPRQAGGRLYFLSNLSGRLSLYAMDEGGSVPEPLLPADIALQNPKLIGGEPYAVFPELGKILVMIDKDGDENYQPMLIPWRGFRNRPLAMPSRMARPYAEERFGTKYRLPERRIPVGAPPWPGAVAGYGILGEAGRKQMGCLDCQGEHDHTKAILGQLHAGDHVLYLWSDGEGEPCLRKTAGGTRRGKSAERHPCLPLHGLRPGLLFSPPCMRIPAGSDVWTQEREVKPSKWSARCTGRGEMDSWAPGG